jgi:hypothetical protein
MSRILLIDLAERELQARARLATERDQLNKKETLKLQTGGVTAQEAERIKEIDTTLDSDHPVDEFYRAVAQEVTRRSWDDLSNANNPDYMLEYGLFGSQRAAAARKKGLTDTEREIAFVAGLLLLDNIRDPKHPRFVRQVSEAQGEYRQNVDLFNAAHELFKGRSPVTLQSQIDKGTLSTTVIGSIQPGGSIKARLVPVVAAPAGGGAAGGGAAGGGAAGGADGGAEAGNVAMAAAVPAMNPIGADLVAALSTRTVASVVRRLAAEGVNANDTWLASKLETAFNVLTGAVDGRPPSALEIDLPDLEQATDVDIVAENLHAVQAIYFSYQLEEMRLYQVVERIVELFRQGLLPLGRSHIGDYLYKYYQKTAERITESERRDLYFRCFGAPGGNPNAGEPNREFNELWLRFVSAVSSFSRQLTVDQLLRSRVPMAVSQEQVRKAGRDLGANLSRNGYGIAYFAATEMQKSILEFRDVLSDAELRNVFGARDMWQVVDIVNANYLGGARNTHRFRTQSRNGAIIIRWIANRVQRLSNVSGPVLMVDEIVNANLRSNSDHKPTVEPSDWDLVNACEQWLAVGGVQDASIEQYAQPIEAPMVGNRPISGMPQLARDALDAVGISLPA